MRWIRVYKAGIHLGEESIVAGNQRSGLISFSGCHLTCSFCYTPETSIHRFGIDYQPKDFEKVITDLKKRGAENLNLISPTHEWPAIEPSLQSIKKKFGDSLPIILKISGYECRQLIRRMESISDIWVPDFKVYGKERALSVNLPGNYGEVAEMAIQTMMETHGVAQFNSSRKLSRGILVRHLIMPGFFDDSMQVVESLGGIGYQGFLNLMTFFIDPDTKHLSNASPKEIGLLRRTAERYGMTALVNGTSKPEAYQENLPLGKGESHAYFA